MYMNECIPQKPHQKQKIIKVVFHTSYLKFTGKNRVQLFHIHPITRKLLPHTIYIEEYRARYQSCNTEIHNACAHFKMFIYSS